MKKADWIQAGVTLAAGVVLLAMFVGIVYYIDQSIGEEVGLLGDKFDRWLRENPS